MQEEYRSYEKRKMEEYQDTCAYYENARRQSEEEYQETLADYRRELIQQRKRENQDAYGEFLSYLERQYAEKSELLDECRKIVETCEESIPRQQNSYVRFKSIKATLVSLQEAVYKLEAYLRYLDKYREELIKIFEASGELTEPFSMTLPENYPYEGKVFYLSQDEFQNYGHAFEGAGYIRLDDGDRKLFENSSNEARLPFMVYASKKGRLFLSLSKGLVKNSIGGTIGIKMDCWRRRTNGI